MSGIEIAGVLLGAFPLIISGIEHWHNVAKVGGYFWRVRKEFTKCRSDVNYHEILYKRNLKALLLPIVGETDDVGKLVGDPGGEGWKDEALQGRLEIRLQESYKVYMEIIFEMNETAEELKKELSFDKTVVQEKLSPPELKKSRQSSPSKVSRPLISKSSIDYQMFRIRFSVREKVREELFGQLKECNERLEKLLSTSDNVSALQSGPPSATKQMNVLETAFRKACKKSELLFKALQKAWNCSCQHHHYANLRLEHRILPEICFEVILMFVVPPGHRRTPWSWRELQCGHMEGCSSHTSKCVSSEIRSPARKNPSQATPLSPTPKTKKVAFSAVAPLAPRIEVEVLADPTLQLCQLLGDPECSNCMGVIGHDDETYHLHPFNKRKEPDEGTALTLNYILSLDFEGTLSRRQRYSVALLLASSVAQLQFTPWLRTGLTKEDILFFPNEDQDIPFSEPFIQQGFSIEDASYSAKARECNFFSLGILLLELCFGKRLEDQPQRRKHSTNDADSKQAFDQMVALQWSRGVADEGGEDYAAAVKWCFTGAGDASKNWRTEIIKNVIRPLEMCQEHFKTAAIT